MEQEMKEKDELESVSTPEGNYVPRPRWQIISAWIALVVFVITVLACYVRLARGGI